jgi:hypothetical protein
MSKGQQRSNREAKKPKQKKVPAAPPAAVDKRQPPSTGVPKKKTWTGRQASKEVARCCLAFPPDRQGLSCSGGTFIIEAAPNLGGDLDAIETGIDAVIAAIATEGVSEDELNLARNRIVADTVYALDDQFQLADIFGMALSTGQTVEHVLGFSSRVQQVSAEDVRAAAAKVLRIERSVTGTLQPENYGQGRRLPTADQRLGNRSALGLDGTFGDRLAGTSVPVARNSEIALLAVQAGMNPDRLPAVVVHDEAVGGIPFVNGGGISGQ